MAQINQYLFWGKKNPHFLLTVECIPETESVTQAVLSKVLLCFHFVLRLQLCALGSGDLTGCQGSNPDLLHAGESSELLVYYCFDFCLVFTIYSWFRFWSLYLLDGTWAILDMVLGGCWVPCNTRNWSLDYTCKAYPITGWFITVVHWS